MKRPISVTIVAILAVAYTEGCGKDDISHYSLGSETYPNVADCRQVSFNGKPIPGMFAKKLNRAEGSRLEGVACHDKTVVIDATTGNWTEGTLR